MKKILFLLLLIEFSLQSMGDFSIQYMLSAQKDLFEAVEKGDISDINRALKNGADINATVGKRGNAAVGDTALLIAILNKKITEDSRVEVVKELIRHGADVNKKIDTGSLDQHSIPILMYPIPQKKYEIVKILIKAGADVNAKNDLGWNPLMQAILNGNLRMVKLLVKNGADIDQKNDRGETAIDFAKYHENFHIVKYLKNVRKKNIKSRLKVIKPLVSEYVPITQVNIGPGNIILEYLTEDYVPRINKKLEEEKIDAEKSAQEDQGCVIS